MESLKFDPLVHSVPSAAKRLGTNPRAIYGLIATGELRSFKLGKHRLIPDTECQRLVNTKLAEAAK